MTNVLLVLGIVIFVGCGSVLLSQYLNRGIMFIEKQAYKYIRERLSKRELLPISDILEELEQDALKVHGKVFMERLAEILGLDVGYLRLSDTIVSLIRINRCDMTQDDEKIWEKTNLGNHVDVHAYDILHTLEKMIEKEKWSSFWERVGISTEKVNEEALIDYISSMTLKEIVVTFETFGDL